MKKELEKEIDMDLLSLKLLDDFERCLAEPYSKEQIYILLNDNNEEKCNKQKKQCFNSS